jgi:class 3 adenylate cyclase/tetratricopeptide (TPR) repeat protein
MADSIAEQLQQLKTSLTALEGQRALLGEGVVGPALAALRAQITALETQAAAAATGPADERRLITILFTDIVGSTALAEQLDPEAWRLTVARVHETVGARITQHGGQIAQYLGDGLLAFFGAQHAGEADPEHAIRAALDFQTALAEWRPAASAGAGAATIRLRVGIHSGPVVIGDLGAAAHQEFTATGDAMNLAARLQAAAPPGGILISHETYRYVRGVFDVTPQPPLTVKGKREPLRTYQVRRAKPRPFRSVMRGVAGVETRTVGREHESQQLRDAYRDAYENKRVAWAQLVAEPGMGKSRLLEDTREWLELRPETVWLLRARAYVEDARQPFALVRRMWFDRFQIAEDAPLAQAEARWVQQVTALLGPDEVEAAQALGLLVGLPFEGSPHLGALRLDPAQVKGRALVVSRALVAALRAQNPIELLLEDLHAADASSVEYFLDVIWNAAPAEGLNGVFVLATARPEWSVPHELTAARDDAGPLGETNDEGPISATATPNKEGAVPGHRPAQQSFVQIRLAPLADGAARELARELLQQAAGVPDELVALIVERSEGVPYYAEELVNYFLDRGILDASAEPWRCMPERLREAPLPATLQHLLLTRLGGLSGEELAALQRGAVFGRNFWTGGIEALGASAGTAMLTSLQPRGFLDPQMESSLAGQQEWSFHHNLLRDITYETVLKRERAALHQKAAEWLEAQARTAGRLDEFAGLLGEHCQQAGALNEAAGWLARAGERAMAQGAPREARGYFDRALALLPPVAREARWQALLGREATLDRLGEREAQQADVQALLGLAESMDDDIKRTKAFRRQAGWCQAMGDWRAVLVASEQALMTARRASQPAQEAMVLARMVAAHTWLGELDAARARADEALDRARASGDDAALAAVLLGFGLYYYESGDLARAVQLTTEAAAVAQRVGDRAREASALGNSGFDSIQLGSTKRARLLLEQALRLHEAVGDRRGRAYDLQNLGWVHFRAGDGRAARRLEDEALRELTTVGDAFGRAGCLLYLGCIAEQAGDAAGAARRFGEAREEFSRLEARAKVLDCSAGLARCALAQGQLEAARQAAAEVWQVLSDDGPAGLELPALGYLTCVEVFEALGELETARAALAAGYREVMTRAEKISKPEWRQSFLDNIPEHRALVAQWERSQAGPG